MHEEDSEVDHVEVRDRSVEAGRERPGERHQEVTPATREYVRGARQEGLLLNAHVVRVTAQTPPAGSKQPSATLGLQKLQV